MATNISFSTYGFMNGILILSEENWRRFFKPFITDSVQSGLATIEGANMTVYVSAGECRCGAVMGILDEMIVLDVADGDSTYDRIDSVIVQYTYGEPSTLAVAIVQGTPSANPVPPTLTKVYDTLWQMEIAQILVPSGATSASEFTITDKRVIYESIESIIDDNTESEERVWSSQKTHEEIVSLSTEIYDSLNTKADAIERTTSGDIVTITDGGDNIPVKELVVGIEPVQDLHGQANPYPAGGGKNIGKLSSSNIGNYQKLDVSFTETGAVFTPTGTYGRMNFTFQVTVGLDYTVSFDALADTDYRRVFYGTDADAWTNTEYGNEIIPSGTLTHITKTFTATDTLFVVGFYVSGSGSTGTETISNFQLEQGSSATSYAPYSNICPISGWSQAVVTRTGKNLCDYIHRDTAGYTDIIFENDDDGLIVNIPSASSSVRNRQFAKYIIPAGTYAFSVDSVENTMTFLIQFQDIQTGAGYHTYVNVYKNKVTNYTITLDRAYYMKMSVQIRANVAAGSYKIHPQVEIGSTITPYEPYQGQTVTIDLNGTRYGGTVNVLTGEMVITKVFATFSSVYGAYSSGVGYCYMPSSIVKGDATVLTNYLKSTAVGMSGLNDNEITTSGGTDSVINFKIAGCTTKAEYNDYLSSNNLQVCCTLLSPQTVQLTANQMQMLMGYNAIWADTGDILDLTYPVESKSFIDEQIAESQIKTRQMMTVVTDQMIAPNNLSTNDIVVVNDELYKATANIASGEEMTVGTNVIKITLAEYIQSLL